MTIFQSEEYQSYKGMITILLNSINSAREPYLFGSRAEFVIQTLMDIVNYFTTIFFPLTI